jgi:hypothetical protein
MHMKAFTTFGIGAAADRVIDQTLQPLPSGITAVREVSVPDGVNGSKLGTWIQRAALDNAVPDDCPEDQRAYVVQAAGLLDDPNTALAIDMSGNPAGDKMRVRMGAADGERAFLVFGLTAAD